MSNNNDNNKRNNANRDNFELSLEFETIIKTI